MTNLRLLQASVLHDLTDLGLKQHFLLSTIKAVVLLNIFVEIFDV